MSNAQESGRHAARIGFCQVQQICFLECRYFSKSVRNVNNRRYFRKYPQGRFKNYLETILSLNSMKKNISRRQRESSYFQIQIESFLSVYCRLSHFQHSRNLKRTCLRILLLNAFLAPPVPAVTAPKITKKLQKLGRILKI